MRQDREDGGWVQQSVNHMYDPIGRHNISAYQVDPLFTQQDLTLGVKGAVISEKTIQTAADSVNNQSQTLTSDTVMVTI